MFTYSIAKAVNMGWIDKSYISIALEGWNGVKRNINNDGQVRNICMGTGIEENLVYYYTRPTPLNDIHGLGAILLAGDEIIKYKRSVVPE
jgi:unsaturated rhamnogalacturonyl hydrolase